MLKDILILIIFILGSVLLIIWCNHNSQPKILLNNDKKQSHSKNQEQNIKENFERDVSPVYPPWKHPHQTIPENSFKLTGDLPDSLKGGHYVSQGSGPHSTSITGAPFRVNRCS